LNPDKPKRTRSREATTAAIMAAATRAFAEVGYDAATTRGIAERAGVSEGLIHRYFGSKEGLLVAMMRKFLEDSASQPSLRPGGKDLAPAIERFFLESLLHHDDAVDAMRVLVSRAIIDPKVGAMMGEDIAQRHVPGIAEPLSAAGHQNVESAAFVLSAFSFVLGFMAPHVFGLEREQLKKTAGWLARAVANELERD
jgi:AcrR family transcriptional regulator